MGPEASVAGVALGTTTTAQWKQMGAAIVAGVEAGWVNPVINKVSERSVLLSITDVCLRSTTWSRQPRSITTSSTAREPRENWFSE